jgi:prolyl 4-hydroxylase
MDIEVISLTPRAFVIEDFLSDFESDAIVKMSKDRLKESSVGEAGSGIFHSNTRTSLNTWLNKESSPMVSSIFLRAADLLQIDPKLLNEKGRHIAEDLQVVHYDIGQKYDSHHDWGVSGYPQTRYITLLMYLNDRISDSSGGETSFPLGVQADGTVGFKVRPPKNSAVLFYNLLPDGNADNLALHGALPVNQGEKWLANFWLWDDRFHAE